MRVLLNTQHASILFLTKRLIFGFISDLYLNSNYKPCKNAQAVYLAVR